VEQWEELGDGAEHVAVLPRGRVDGESLAQEAAETTPVPRESMIGWQIWPYGNVAFLSSSALVSCSASLWKLAQKPSGKECRAASTGQSARPEEENKAGVGLEQVRKLALVSRPRILRDGGMDSGRPQP
jgi:hypothetical protein